MSCSVGVVWSVGMIEISCCSFSWCCLFGDFVIRLLIFSILRFTCSLFLMFFFAGVVIFAVGSLDVYIVTGLPCEELEARLIVSIDLFEWHCDVSSWALDEWESWRCRNFALFNFVCASAASLDFLINWLVDFWGHFVGCVFLFCCCCFRWLGPGSSCRCEGPGTFGFCCVLALSGLSGLSSWVGRPWLMHIAVFSCACFCLFSVNRNCFIFSWFLLYSRTVSQAKNCISLGLDSVTIAKSFFLITVFFSVIRVWCDCCG